MYSTVLASGIEGSERDQAMVYLSHHAYVNYLVYSTLLRTVWEGICTYPTFKSNFMRNKATSGGGGSEDCDCDCEALALLWSAILIKVNALVKTNVLQIV